MTLTAARTFFLAALLPWFIGATAVAEPSVDPYAAYQGRFRMGMEIELQPSLLKGLVYAFDWNEVEKDLQSGKVEIFDELLKEYFTGKDRPLARRDADFLARLAIELAPGPEESHTSYPPLRKDLTPEQNQIFAGLKWHHDNDKLEFSHAKPLTDPREYLAHVRRFARAAGIETRLDNPLDKRRHELSYHMHFSRVNGIDISETLAAYNRLVLMRLVHGAAAEELFVGNRVSKYSENLHNRGIVRQIALDHFEIRRHTATPEEELLEMMRWFGMPPDQARQEIVDATLVLLTEKNLHALTTLGAGAAVAVLGKTASHLPPEKARKTLETPFLVNAVLGAAHPLEKLQRTENLLRALVANAEAEIPGAREMLSAFSNRLQTGIEPGRLERWLVHSYAENFEYVLDTTARYATTPGPRIDVAHPTVGSVLNGLDATKISPWDIANFYSHFAERNPIARAGLYQRLAVPGPLREPLVVMSPASLFTSPEGWLTLREVLKSAEPRIRVQAFQRLAEHHFRYSPQQLADAYLLASLDSSADVRTAGEALSPFAITPNPRPPALAPVTEPAQALEPVRVPKPAPPPEAVPPKPPGWFTSLATECRSLLAQLFRSER